MTISGRRKRLSGWGASQEEAAADLRSKISGSSKGETVWTLQRFANERYIPAVQNLSEKWKGQIAWALDGHIYPAFGSDLLRNVDRHRIQLALNAKLRVLSRASVGHLRKVLFAILSLAEADGLLSSNPVKHVKLPPIKHVEHDTYSPEEVGKLLAASTPPLRDFIVLAACLGLRAGEAAGVRWKRGDTHIRVETSKTRAGVRSLPIEPGMLSNAGRLPPGYKWVSRIGDELKECAGQAGLRYISAHGLRRSFASNLRKMNCPAEMRKDLMGHAGDVQRRYSGEWEKGARKWVKSLWKAVSSTCSNGGKRGGKAA